MCCIIFNVCYSGATQTLNIEDIWEGKIVFEFEIKDIKYMNESWMQVMAIIGSNLVIMLTFFGVTISLHNGMREEIREMQQDRKEFHGRLCSIEERNKK